MQYGNGRPLGIRKTVRLMVALTILAWATQTLLSQWGYGAPPAEKFVPRDETNNGGGAVTRTVTLEVRPDATVVGADVKLKQICRWSGRDAAFFAPVADLVVARVTPGEPFRAIGIQELRATLHDAGVNAAVVNFAGALSCTISRSDVQLDEHDALQQWANARVRAKAPAAAASATSEEDAATVADKPQMASAVEPAETPVAPARAVAPEMAEESPYRSLRQVLVADLAQRLGLAVEQLQVDFSPKDERPLNLSEPHFKFHVTPQRAKSLGPVTWEVLLLADGGNQKLTVQAVARAWQDQVVLKNPISTKQVIRDVDVTERRALVDRLSDEPLLARAQVVGNQAARDMKPGTVFTARVVEPVPLARPGQFVTITITSGSVRIKTVARAMDTGTFGQTIRVKNEATKDIYEVTLTGPQMAEMTPARMSTAGGADLAAAMSGGN